MPVCEVCGFEAAQPFKFCPECGAPFAAEPAREQRKTVTVLFCDVTGSTALGESSDPEALRSLLAQYFERMKGIVEAHGGSVEKFIGDAVMAVFGVPVVHEDDALRAVRAAVAMRDALPELGVQARIGVNTGEVVTGTAERLATGDAVNVAARLEQAAQPGEILIGSETFGLVRDAVEVEAVQPLALKGKSGLVAASRLVAVTEAATRRHREGPMVGRETELQRLRAAFEQALRDRSCQLFTVLGNAGVGKSRVASEFLSSIDAPVVSGRCLPYGEGITYWPVLEVIEQLPEIELDTAAQASLSSLLPGSDTATSSDEIAWAFRKLLEAAAQEEPLVVVFDDLHWGEDTFLDLVEHVADLSRGAPLLLLCMARPELLDRRAAWAGGKLNATNVLLEPLSPEQTEVLISALAVELPGSVSRRVIDAAEGNPLFVEEMVALARESEAEVLSVPPTIQALLAARLDQLDTRERGVLERGAVEGRVFHRGAVQALGPEESQITARLTSLVRKELVRPDKAQFAGEDAFRFRHLLIRDAAYESLPKAVRADLHERFALWLEEHGSDIAELDEIVGYHLEQTVRYRRELGQPVDAAVAADARRHLMTGGRRAGARGDDKAAADLLGRAGLLVAPGEYDVELETDLAEALMEIGDGTGALERTRSLAERAAAAGDRVGELCAQVQEGRFRTFLDPEGATEQLEELLREAMPMFEEAGNDLALYLANYARGQVANMRAEADAGAHAYDSAAAHARRAGLAHDFVGWRALFRSFGATPVPELLRWLDEQEAAGLQTTDLVKYRAEALAMLGRFDEARSLLSEVRSALTDRGAEYRLAGLLGFEAREVELLAGEPGAAVELGRESCGILERLGAQSVLSTVAGLLARALCTTGELDDAERWADRAAELGASDDAITQFLWRQAKARVLARRGEVAEAERLAREAVALANETGFVPAQADALADLAEVLSAAGKDGEAAEALREALARYEQKQNLVMAERMRDQLASLRERTAT